MHRVAQTTAVAAGAVMMALVLVGCGSDAVDPPGGSGGNAGEGGAQGEGGSAGAGAQGGGGAGECEYLDLQPDEVGPHGAVALFQTDDVFAFGEGHALSDSHVYFSSGEQLLRVPITGGSVEVLGTLPNGRKAMFGDTMVWTEEQGSPDSVRLLAAPAMSLSTSAVLAENIRLPGVLTLDATNVYYDQSEPQAIWKVPLAGGGAPEALVPSGHPLGMISHDDALYWLDFETTQLERVARDGGARDPLADVFFGGPMAAAGASVFWADTSLGTINQWRDGAAAIDVLLDASSSDDRPAAIAVSGDTVYWLQGFGCVELWQVQTNGTGARRTAVGFSDAAWLAANESHVFVVGRDSVYRVDR